ncbi:MAG TPA: type II CAAX endopeptidase family protein [Bryobacteraceae bacterium]
MLFVGLVIPCMLAGWALVKAALGLLHLHPTLRVLELLPEQLIGYALLFGALALILRIEYDRPFWSSLGWKPFQLPILWVVLGGVVTSLSVAYLGSLIHTPTTSNPMTELLENRTSAILMAIFGIGIAPLCEELAFRGFLQPLVVRSLGAAPGIVVAAIPFGLLHYREFGNSWRHAVLIALAGATFGWIRHVTDSTRASTLMHASYNAFIFVAVFTQEKDLAR